MRKEEQEQLLKMFEELIEKLGIKLSYEPLKSSTYEGGLCKVIGNYRIILNKKLNTLERVSVLKDCLKKIDLKDVFIPPLVREFLEKDK